MVKKLHFKKLHDLDTTVVNNLHLIPRDIDIIVGVPRSGMLLAGIICMYINKPLLTLGEFLSDADYITGYYRPPPPTQYGKVLVVDDAIGRGVTMRTVKDKLARKKVQTIYLVAYASEKTVKLADICLDVLPTPRAWQWNMFHHPARRMMWDLDGVICENPPDKKTNNFPQKYRAHLANAKPAILPSFPVDIVTGRRESSRNETEKWLKAYNVKYNRLIMRPVEIEGEWQEVARYKAKHYAESNKELFVESSPLQAKIIARITNKPVFCLKNRKLYNG